MQTPLLKATFAAIAIAALAIPGQARVTKLVVEHTEPLGHDGYQKLTGHVYGELDPKLPLNAIITDIDLAPRNAHGLVEYSATFTIIKPADMSKASGVLLYVVPNRGHIDMTNGGFIADARKHGDVLVASGWQADLDPAAGMETLIAPVAKNLDGSSITGPVLARFSDMPADSRTLPILRGGVAGTADPASFDTSNATLTRRASEDSAEIPLRSTDWAFADCGKSPFPGTPDPQKICLKNGFNPAYLYELVYTAKDPKVYGIGFAATRDLNSYLRYGTQDDAGTANVLGDKIKWTISQGNSQSGNYLRTFIHLGFNQDETGRIVFDGTNPNIAVRLQSLNIRFATPSGAAAKYEAGSDGVVWWEDYADEARGHRAAGLLDRCRATETCPKIVETFGSSEFYNLRASPDLVGTRADRDIPLPTNVRRYYFPGVRHGGGPGGFDPDAKPESCCGLAMNPNPSRDTLRALQTALVEWVVKGTLPPPSVYPRLDRGELAAPTHVAMGFPTIPGVPFPDGILNPLYEYDFGSKFHYNDLSGIITMQPPPIRQVLPVLVPKVDSDGNEVTGVASVLHQAPLGTYTGWNTVAGGFYKNHVRTNTGAFIPFAKTKAERLASGDPRPSLEERYGTHEKYVSQVRTAAERLVRGRYLIQDDADRLIGQAEASKVLR
ncbi:MAG: alpha/beta hydrolase domain-containing protein [Acidobacteriota bacterium]